MWCLAGGVGPVLGGAFTQYASWRWCFWINIPVSGITFILLVLFLDVHNPKTEILDGVKAIDWWGSFSKVICLIVFGCLMSILFIFSEKRLARYPLMPLSLFRNPSNVASLVLCFVHGFVSRPRQYFVEIIQTDRFWCRSS